MAPGYLTSSVLEQNLLYEEQQPKTWLQMKRNPNNWLVHFSFLYHTARFSSFTLCQGLKLFAKNSETKFDASFEGNSLISIYHSHDAPESCVTMEKCS